MLESYHSSHSHSHVKTDTKSNFSVATPESIFNLLSDSKWNQILTLSSQINVSLIHKFPSLYTIQYLQQLSLSNQSTLFIRVVYLLYIYSSIQKSQHYLSGYQNIWIIKAPEASKGTNIKLFSSLQEILQYEKGMSGRIAQKYIERPLLIPFSRFNFHSSMNVYSSSSSSQYQSNQLNQVNQSNQGLGKYVKFDLRIWVLVTSSKLVDSPLCIYIYNEVYGRRCSSSYNQSYNNLNDLYKHLTNYSIQKCKVNSNTSVVNGDGLNENLGQQFELEEFGIEDEMNEIGEVEEVVGEEGIIPTPIIIPPIQVNDINSGGGVGNERNSSLNESVKLFASKVFHLRDTVQNYRAKSLALTSSTSSFE